MAVTSPPESLLASIRAGHNFLLTSHMNPDGDAIGSELGLARLLRQMGKRVTVWNLDPAPGVYAPLPGFDQIHLGPEAPAGFPEEFSHFVTLECPGSERCGLQDRFSGLEVLNIDHHLGNQLYGAVDWVDTRAPAVGEMVFRLAGALGLEIDPATADCLYLTLVTDTGGFRFSNTTAETFDAAAALVRAGARPEQVGQWLYESQPEAAVRLLAAMLETMQLHHSGRFATVWLRQEMFRRCQAKPGDAEGLIDTPRSIAGVEAVALFKELEQERYKVSLRSSGIIDVELIARRFGGGGHHNAAGFAFEGDAETLQRVTHEAVLSGLDGRSG